MMSFVDFFHLYHARYRPLGWAHGAESGPDAVGVSVSGLFGLTMQLSCDMRHAEPWRRRIGRDCLSGLAGVSDFLGPRIWEDYVRLLVLGFWEVSELGRWFVTLAKRRLSATPLLRCDYCRSMRSIGFCDDVQMSCVRGLVW